MADINAQAESDLQSMRAEIARHRKELAELRQKNQKLMDDKIELLDRLNDKECLIDRIRSDSEVQIESLSKQLESQALQLKADALQKRCSVGLGANP